MTQLPPPPPPPSVGRKAPQASASSAPTAAPLIRFGRATKTKVGLRLVLNAVEGWGKTSMIAYAPAPFILMARGETGLVTLINADRVPAEVGTLTDGDGNPKAAESWSEVLATLAALIDSPYQTIGLDAMGGFERLCHEHVCNRDFGGDWGERGFESYGRGPNVSVADWTLMLLALDRLVNVGKSVVLLSHSKVKAARNPMGADYDRFVVDANEKTWAPTARWCDAVLFGTFFSVVQKDNPQSKASKAKGIGGDSRILYTEQRDAFVAKNRFGMAPMLDIPNDPTATWQTIMDAMKPS